MCYNKYKWIYYFIAEPIITLLQTQLIVQTFCHFFEESWNHISKQCIMGGKMKGLTNGFFQNNISQCQKQKVKTKKKQKTLQRTWMTPSQMGQYCKYKEPTLCSNGKMIQSSYKGRT